MSIWVSGCTTAQAEVLHIANHGAHRMAMAFISSSALCAGLQSTAVTDAAPCRHMLMALQPPLVSVRHESPLPTCSTYRAGNTYVRLCVGHWPPPTAHMLVNALNAFPLYIWKQTHHMVCMVGSASTCMSGRGSSHDWV